MRAAGALVLFALGAPGMPGDATANGGTRIVLHALPAHPTNDCFTADDLGFDCMTTAPSVELMAGEAADVYVYLRGFEDICLLQCAFDWPAEWQFAGWGPFQDSACLSGTVAVQVPGGPGPEAGSLSLRFDRILGGFLQVVGMMRFTAGVGGCLDIVESSLPGGTFVADCALDVTAIAPEARGRVCAGPGGIDSCNPYPGPVVPATWSAIKGMYRPRASTMKLPRGPAREPRGRATGEDR